MKNSVELVEVWRGDYLECTHRGAAVIVDETGDIVESWGDPSEVILPRSSLKPLQALPLVSSGAAEAHSLSTEHLALACASHQGQAMHTDRAAAWLDTLGLGNDDLQCGPQWPDAKRTANEMVKAGEKPCRIHNNCSGKHCGFLTLGAHLGEAPERYLDPEGAVQQASKTAIEDICSEDILGHAIDGCSAPNFAISLTGMARGMAKMGNHILTQAMMAHPELVAGDKRACTEMMQSMSGKAAVKTGAEGVFAAILPEKKMGIALKIEDGATRASECVMAALLVRMGVANPDDPTIAKRLNPIQRNRADLEVGVIKPSAALTD